MFDKIKEHLNESFEVPETNETDFLLEGVDAGQFPEVIGKDADDEERDIDGAEDTVSVNELDYEDDEDDLDVEDVEPIGEDDGKDLTDLDEIEEDEEEDEIAEEVINEALDDIILAEEKTVDEQIDELLDEACKPKKKEACEPKGKKVLTEEDEEEEVLDEAKSLNERLANRKVKRAKLLAQVEKCKNKKQCEKLLAKLEKALKVAQTSLEGLNATEYEDDIKEIKTEIRYIKEVITATKKKMSTLKESTDIFEELLSDEIFNEDAEEEVVGESEEVLDEAMLGDLFSQFLESDDIDLDEEDNSEDEEDDEDVDVDDLDELFDEE